MGISKKVGLARASVADTLARPVPFVSGFCQAAHRSGLSLGGQMLHVDPSNFP